MRSLVALVALGLLVAVHELAHWAMARLLRIDVDQVTLGMGPALFSWKWGRTRWSLGLIPLGASTRLSGSNPHQSGPPSPRGFLSQPSWRRALVVAAGPLASYLVALALLVTLYVVGTHAPVNLAIGSVEPGSAAAKAGLRPGDVVSALGGAPLEGWSDLVERIAAKPGMAVELIVVRPAGSVTIWVEPRADAQGQGRLGIGQQYTFRRQAFAPALLQAFTHTRSLALEGLGLVARLARREGATASVPTELLRRTDRGLDGWIRMGVGLSVALALFYLLPFPSLDGGKLVLIGLERARGKKLPPWVETLLQALFFVLLGGGALWVVWRSLKP